jgi:hypothetical protein
MEGDRYRTKISRFSKQDARSIVLTAMTNSLRRVGLGILIAGGLLAQSESVPLAFEVASIKPSAADARGMSLQLQPPSGLRASNVPVRMLITFAYDVRDFQILGGPGWIGSDRFDILAKAERTPGSENVPDDPRKMTDAQRMTKMGEMRFEAAGGEGSR